MCENTKSRIHELCAVCDCRKIPDPSSQKLNWLKTPLSVLVIKKPYDPTVTLAFRDLVIWLIQVRASPQGWGGGEI